jgi:large subunit ribosomal protein L25
MAEVKLAATPRTEFGKGAARRVRRDGLVPAVLYGHGEEPRHFSLPGHDLMLALKRDQNVLLRLEVDGGETHLAIPRSVVRDPIKRFLEHVDLLLVRQGEKVTADIPVTLVGTAAPDTVVELQLTAVPLLTEATAIPSGIEVSIEGLTAGQSIHASQLELPAGSELAIDAETVVVHGSQPRSAAAVEADAVTGGPAAGEVAAAEAASTE